MIRENVGRIAVNVFFFGRELGSPLGRPFWPSRRVLCKMLPFFHEVFHG